MPHLNAYFQAIVEQGGADGARAPRRSRPGGRGVRRDERHRRARGLRVPLDQAGRGLRSTLVVATNEHRYIADVATDLQDLPLVRCNAGDLNQVFLNLSVNAAHAIADKVERGLIKIHTGIDGDHAVISVTDSGCGIPPEIADRIFDPFFTTKEVGRGTGQGLAISRTLIVERHAGTLTFESEVGQGTTFRVRLPVAGQPGLDAPESLAA